jgi:ABC-type uncharacterized transport system substrate-binding protein
MNGSPKRGYPKLTGHCLHDRPAFASCPAFAMSFPHFRLMKQKILTALMVFFMAMAAWPAFAHPHVWVSVKTELMFEKEGRLSGLHHIWTFDEGYSTFATQGLDTNHDGILSESELAELAKINVESLSESDFFTFMKSKGQPVAFSAPRDAKLTFSNKQLTLSFVLPLKDNAQAQTVSLEIYDPSYFVEFRIKEGEDAILLKDAPQGCKTSITRPKAIEVTDQKKLSEAFFEALDTAANFGQSYANRAVIVCP